MSTALTSQIPLLKFPGNTKIALSNSKNNCHFLSLQKNEKEKKNNLRRKWKGSDRLT